LVGIYVILHGGYIGPTMVVVGVSARAISHWAVDPRRGDSVGVSGSGRGGGPPGRSGSGGGGAELVASWGAVVGPRRVREHVQRTMSARHPLQTVAASADPGAADAVSGA
jgi:hypothetical protein